MYRYMTMMVIGMSFTYSYAQTLTCGDLRTLYNTSNCSTCGSGSSDSSETCTSYIIACTDAEPGEVCQDATTNRLRIIPTEYNYTVQNNTLTVPNCASASAGDICHDSTANKLIMKGFNDAFGLETNKITLKKSIIPSTNSQFDLGSAEYKIRHLYLSNN